MDATNVVVLEYAAQSTDIEGIRCLAILIDSADRGRLAEIIKAPHWDELMQNISAPHKEYLEEVYKIWTNDRSSELSPFVLFDLIRDLSAGILRTALVVQCPTTEIAEFLSRELSHQSH